MSTREAKEKYEKQLLAIPGVSGVGFNSSIIVYVRDVSPETLQFIPRTLDGVKVTVKRARPRILSLVPPTRTLVPMAAIYANRTERIRPVPGGYSIGHQDVTAGTLGCTALDMKEPRIVGVSNNHVLALQWGDVEIGVKGDPILQPGPYDGGTLPADSVGELERWVPVKKTESSLIDGAIFSSEELSGEIEEIGVHDLVAQPYVGMKLVKSGRTSGINYCRIADVNATMKVEGHGICWFRKQIVVEPAVLFPGDSGSWGGEVDSFRTVGIGFAGDDNISLFNYASEFNKLLDIQIMPPLEYLKVRYAVLPLALGAVFANLGGVKVAS